MGQERIFLKIRQENTIQISKFDVKIKNSYNKIYLMCLQCKQQKIRNQDMHRISANNKKQRTLISGHKRGNLNSRWIKNTIKYHLRTIKLAKIKSTKNINMKYRGSVNRYSYFCFFFLKKAHNMLPSSTITRDLSERNSYMYT